jgi:hypothetical protein
MFALYIRAIPFILLRLFINAGSGMTMFESGPPNHLRRSRQLPRARQQRTGLTAAGDVIPTWTVASYDYAG